MESAMNALAVEVLFVSKSAKGCSFLLEQLEKQGCDCHMATSCPEATRLSAGRAFDLVLSIGQMEGIDALIASFHGSSTTLFRCYPVEESCWWLPVVWRGKECTSTPALRPSEFAVVLDRLMDEMKSGKTPVRETNPASDGGNDTSIAQTPRVKQTCESPVGGLYDYVLRRTVLNGQEDSGQI